MSQYKDPNDHLAQTLTLERIQQIAKQMRESGAMQKLNPNNLHVLPSAGNIAIVTTQAGFKKFVKQWIADKACCDGFDYLIGYPKQYPSFVTLSQNYSGYFYPHATCVPLSDITDFLKSFNGA